MDDNLQLKIESYISNSMSKKDQELFEKEIAINANLKKEVALAKDLNHFLCEEYLDSELLNNESVKEIKTYLNSDDAKKIESTLIKVKNEYHFSRSKPKKRNYYFAVASIIILFISVIGYLNFNSDSLEKLFAQYYSVNDLPSLTKRDDSQSNLVKGITAFNDVNYNKSLELFKIYSINSKTINPSVYLYSGIANMELGQYKEAIIFFDKIINSNAIDKSKGLWFKAMLYLKMKDLKNARKTLEMISKTDFKYKEANELLKKFD